MFKKILIVLVLFSLIIPLTTRAQTADGQSRSAADLERQIRELTQQLERLRGNVDTGTSQQWCHTFNQNLGVGMNNDEVSYLYGALMRSGLITAGSDNRRNENIYDENTASAVSQFQEKYREDILTASGLSAPTGYFGPASRKKMNSLYGCIGIKPPIYSKSSITLRFNTGGDNFVATISLTDDNGQVVKPITIPSFAPYFSLSPGYYNATLDTKEYRNNQLTSNENHRITARLKVGGSAAGGSVYSIEGSTINIDGESNTDLLKLVADAFVRSNYVDIAASSGSEYVNVKFTLTDKQGRVVNTASSILPAYRLPVGHYVAGISINGSNNNNEEIKLSIEANSAGYLINFNEKQPVPYPMPIPAPAQPLIVIYPMAGDAWMKGQTYKIIWSASPSTADSFVRISLVGKGYYSEITPKTINDGVEYWTIPSTVPTGEYQVSVSLCRTTNDCYWNNWSGLFKIYGDDGVPANMPPTISGVSGPTTRNVGQMGTWTVRAYDPDPPAGGGSLSYSVWWGDEVYYSPTAGGASTNQKQEISQSATFTHTYSRAGTFSPTFTVTDNSGQSAQTSLSVVVGGGVVSETKITPESLPAVVKGQYYNQIPYYSQVLKASGFSSGNLTWSIISGALPNGFSLNKQSLLCPATGPCPNTETYSAFIYGNTENVALGTYTFTVQATNGTQTARREYKLDVVGTNDSNSSVQVLSPNGGESWIRGGTHTISWGATGAPEVSVYLVKDSDPTYRLAIRHNFVSGRANSITWTVPGGDTATTDIAVGSDYRIWVIGGGATAVDDKSDQPFKIVGSGSNTSPTFTGIPSVPASVKVGQIVSLGWSAQDKDNDDLVWSVSWGDGEGQQGSCQIVNPQNGAHWAFNTFHIWSKPGQYTAEVSVSDCRGGIEKRNFTINVVMPVNVLSPVASDVWPAGSTQTIRWNSPGTNIWLFMGNAGSSVVGPIVVSPVPNTGSYTFTIPSNFETGQHFIRLTCTGGECGNNQWYLWNDSEVFKITS
ncbi:MAG: Ser-Thr-rich GPI-anchored membrane family protein [Candidatus Vogelbacteria bacterium]